MNIYWAFFWIFTAFWVTWTFFKMAELLHKRDYLDLQWKKYYLDLEKRNK